MPMTDALIEALQDPEISEDQLLDLLKKDGINARESLSLDTPLILATRYNNLPVVQIILELIKTSPDKYNTLNATNNADESALSIALKISTDKKIALLLLQNGADPEIGITDDISEEGKALLNAFIEYQHLHKMEEITQTDLEKRAAAEYTIGKYFVNELQDIATAHEWYGLAANDGSKEAMLTIATDYKNAGYFAEAAIWYKRCFPLWTDKLQRESIIKELKLIAEASSEDPDVSYETNKSLALIYIEQGDMSSALTCLLHAEEIFNHLQNQNEGDATFFKACSLWNGPSYQRGTTIQDCLDYSKRIHLLMEAGTEEAYALITGIARSNSSPLSQLIACQMTKNAGMSNPSLQESLSKHEYQPWLEALSYIYGWNGKPKNVLRGASLLKKLMEKEKTSQETQFIAYCLMAYIYCQQETEKEIYLSEALNMINKAYASLGTIASPRRSEIIHVILAMDEYLLNDEIFQDYYPILMNGYIKEIERMDLNNIKVIADKIISISDKIKNNISAMTETLMTHYKKQKNTAIQESIVDFFNQLKEKFILDSEAIIPLEKALAECSELAMEVVEKADGLTINDTKAVDTAVESFKRYAEHAQGDEKEVYIKKHADTLILKAESLLKQGNYEEALKDYQEAYESSSSPQALCKIALIQSDSGLRDEALGSYQILSENEEAKNDFSLLYSALHNLAKLYEELPPRSQKRKEISEIMKIFLKNALILDLSGEDSHIKSSNVLNEFNDFLIICENDSELKEKLDEIKNKITPEEKEKIQEEKRVQQVEKMIESTKNSSKRHISTLISLLDSEKNDKKIIAIVRQAITRWLESSVKIDADHVFIKDEEAITQLAKRGIIAATYYLARHLAQENNYQAALSVCARIIMTPQAGDTSETTETVKSLARSFIEECAGQQLGKGLNKLFSNQQQIIEYAKDLLETINSSPVSTDPDTSIEAFLHEKPLGPDSSYNKYILDISRIGLKEKTARPQRAQDRRGPQDGSSKTAT